jgi:hypothetical protein
VHARNGNFAATEKIMISKLRKITSLALDDRKSYMFYPGSDFPNRIYVYNFNTKNLQHIVQDREHFSELATDWITGNLYYIANRKFLCEFLGLTLVFI